MGHPPVLSPLWKIIRIPTKYCQILEYAHEVHSWAQYWVTGLVGGLGCINKSFGTHYRAQYGQKGLYSVCMGHICCIRLILGPERGYLNTLVQENHCKYDQNGWSYKYLETHVFRCAKKKNPKKSFFIIFMGSNLGKMPAQTQLAVHIRLWFTR